MDTIRVLQIVNYMDRGGLETMLMNYYRHIDRKKIQFDFLVHREKEAQYDNEIEELGGRIYRVPQLNPFSSTYRINEMDFFHKHFYQIVHCHMDCMSAFPLFHAKRAGVPVRIAHSHSTSQNKDIKYPIKMMCKQFIPMSATHLFACGMEAGEFMFGKNKFKIMRNAIEMDKFLFDVSIRSKVRDKFGFKDEVVLGHVANFGRAKNHLYLLDIFNEYHKLNPKSKLLLVGDGSERKNIENKIGILGLRNDVVLAGVRSDVNKLLQAMDVFVFPSLYEGLPVTMIEAQTSGLPCVISQNVPQETDITELVFRVSLDAPLKEWVEKIESALKIKRESQKEVIQKSGFDIKENVNWLENFYTKVYEKCAKRF